MCDYGSPDAEDPAVDRHGATSATLRAAVSEPPGRLSTGPHLGTSRSARANWELAPPLVCGDGFRSATVEPFQVLAEPEAAVYEEWLLERLLDETVALAIKQKLVSHHTTLDGALVQANASHKSFVPIEAFLKPEEYTQRIRSLDQTQDQDPITSMVTFLGKRRSKQTHVSTTDPTQCWATKEMGRRRWRATPSMG